MYDMTPYLRQIDRVIAQGPYLDTWESLSRIRVPRWYEQAKFGIFIHWGVYSVPAFGNEWYSRNMYVEGSREYEHHLKTYGQHKDFGYKDFIPLFKGEKFNAGEWAELFEAAGARYVVPVAEHHDGFQMYQSDISHFNAAEMGPCRDVLGELKEELAKRGITLGASTHRVEHWFFMNPGRKFDSDIHEPLNRGDLYWPSVELEPPHNLFNDTHPSDEFMQDWLVRTCEIVDRYHPQLVYFDWWIEHPSVKPWLRKFAAYYYNRAHEWGVEAAINYKHEAFMFGSAVPDVERGQFAHAKPYFWQTDTATARNSWGYTENNDFKSAKGLICDLVDIVSKNGTMLLNIGPRADGSITEEDQAILREIGQWLSVNGEAIYGSKVWRLSAEGPTEIQEGQFTDQVEKTFTPEDIRFTVAGGYLYATVLQWPEDGSVCIRSLAHTEEHNLPVFQGMIDAVEVLGSARTPVWTRNEKGLHVSDPSVQSDKPVVIKIHLI